jgi:hypothetical protein
MPVPGRSFVMLIVRPQSYIVPIAEQEFASLTPRVLIVNSGTVGALVTGHCHIYRESTGLRLYTSELAISTIPAGTSLAVSALTPWSPPAPADDDYFIMCDITATSVAPHEPPGIIEQLGPYSFDIKPIGMGPAPAAHGVTHEQGGSDPVLVGDLGTAELDTTKVLAPDGTGGLTWILPPSAPLVESLPTAEMDDTLVLAPDGAGGVEFRAEAGAVGNIESLPTAEMDDALVLAPDGAGGVEFRTEAGGVTDHGALTGLSDNDHPQYQRVLVQTLTDGANIDWDLNAGGQAKITLGGNRTLNNPSNMVAGAVYSLRVIQDGTGTRLITWGNAYLFPGAVKPALTAAPNTTDVMIFLCDGTSMFCIGMTSALA